MKKAKKGIKLKTDATHYICGGCGNLKRIKDGVYKVKIAYNNTSNSQQNGIGLYAKWKIVCEDCFMGLDVDKVKGE